MLHRFGPSHPLVHTPMDAYTRWARLVLDAASCPLDPKTLALWSHHAGISESTLRARCAAARVPAASARDFARMLRLVLRSHRDAPAWDPPRHLEASDPRTIRRLLLRSGLADHPHGAPPPSIDHFLAHQDLVHATALAAVRHVLKARLDRALCHQT